MTDFILEIVLSCLLIGLFVMYSRASSDRELFKSLYEIDETCIKSQRNSNDEQWNRYCKLAKCLMFYAFKNEYEKRLLNKLPKDSKLISINGIEFVRQKEALQATFKLTYETLDGETRNNSKVHLVFTEDEIVPPPEAEKHEYWFESTYGIANACLYRAMDCNDLLELYKERKVE